MFPMLLSCTASTIKKKSVHHLAKVLAIIFFFSWDALPCRNSYRYFKEASCLHVWGVQHSKKSFVPDSYFVNNINFEVSLYGISAWNAKTCTTASYLLDFPTLLMTAISSFDRSKKTSRTVTPWKGKSLFSWLSIVLKPINTSLNSYNCFKDSPLLLALLWQPDNVLLFSLA